jgi:hypothetical protein
VPQGTILGSLLFLFYINDLPENVKANVKLFADDCLLYKEINNISDGQDFQNDLKALESLEIEWQMSFNADKCFIIIAGTKNTKINYEYKIRNQDLEKVPHSKYLGVALSKNLSWKPHINNITKKSNKTLGFLRRNLHSCTHKVKEDAFTTLVRPSLDYASSCWDPHIKEHTEEVEKVQRRGARFVFNNYKSREPGCVTNMLNTLQWEPLAHIRATSRVTMLYKIRNNLVDIAPEQCLIGGDYKTRGNTNTKL